MIGDKSELQEQIDRDKGLKKQRTIVVAISSVMLLLQFSGAKIIEANTFIFKMAFEHQEGIPVLLALAITLSLLRYHNYASKYHSLLRGIWSLKLLNHSKIDYMDPHEPEPGGFLHDASPDNFDILTLIQEPHSSYSVEYKKGFLPFVRYFYYEWSVQGYDDQYGKSVNIREKLGWKNYQSILLLEFKFRILEYIKHREFLDIKAPYLIGGFSILSYLFNDFLKGILT